MKNFTLFNSLPRVLKPHCTTTTGIITKTERTPARLLLAILLVTTWTTGLLAQSSDCVPGSVYNNGDDLWSEQCYLDNNCNEQGNPCQANDVVLLGVFIGDENAGPVATCASGETVSFLLWGKFYNNTNTNRYAVRTCTEVWLNGGFTNEINACSFDVLEPGDSQVALLGEFDYLCEDDIQILNTWVGWSTSAAQCEDVNAPNYNSECGQYPPSKCSKALVFIDFLVPNFSQECGPNSSSSGTEVTFTNLSSGGTAPISYHWDFGDGASSVEEHPSHTYPTTNGSYHVVMTMTDALGVEASAQLFLDLDSLSCCSLTITCPPANGGIFSCLDDIPSPDESLIEILDACGPVSIDVAEANSGSGCSTDTLYVTRSYLVSDGGEIITCTQVFRVVDSQIPILTCPSNVSVECSSLVPPPDPGDLYVIDNCDSAPVVSFEGDQVINLACNNRYQIIRTYEAVDACGNTDVCTHSIFVFDDTPPSITCPAGLTVSCAEDVPDADTDNIITSDGCGGSIVVTVAADQISGVFCDHAYTLTRVYTATDACGNTSTCAQVIIVDDNLPPTVSCPSNITVSCASNIPPANINTVIVSDNCSGSITVTVQPDVISGVFCTNEYTVQRIYVATDDCGNTATCLQTITVRDATSPQLNCPPPLTVSCASAVPLPDINSILATDNCGAGVSVSVQPDQISGQQCVNKYSILRVYVATDACGNTNTCSQTITVNDIIAPLITCPANLTVSCASHIPPSNTAAVISSDNCAGLVNVSVAADVTVDQSCDNNFTVLRTYTARDECGNSSTCTQTIRVQDLTVPVVDCPDDLTLSCTDNTLPIATGQATATDNCGATPAVSYADITSSSGACDEGYVITRTWTATDACNNSTTCVQVLHIVDAAVPEIICPANITVSCASNIPSANTNAVIVSDNCSGTVTVTVQPDVISGVFCANEYTVQRIYVATDDCGNSATCLQTITVRDLTPPQLTCPASVTVSCASAVPLPNINSVLATDNCGAGVTVSVQPDQVTGQVCANKYLILRVYVATDACGNTNTCSQSITVNDNIAPSITCPANLTVSCAGNIPSANTNAVIVSDNCSGTVDVTVQPDVISGVLCANEYTVQRTYVATDVCGNTATCLQTITVRDLTLPQLNCPPPLTVSCASAVPPPNINSILATDNCGAGVTVTVQPDQITGQVCANKYSILRVYVATDACGNTNTCSQSITVNDNITPSITCPANLTVSCASHIPPANTNAVIVSDNCGGSVAVTAQPDVISGVICANEYTVQRIYVATDVCGNTATCLQTITVRDLTLPQLNCPPPLTVSCASAVPLPNINSILSTDNCGAGVTVTVQPDQITGQVCANKYSILRVYVATDACGNTNTCSQSITVNDNIAPSITCPANLTVSCAGNIPPANTNAVIVSDNCNGTVAVSVQPDVISGVLCANAYTVQRIYVATDVCGNTATCLQTITVRDLTPPQLTCPAPITVSCASAVPLPNINSILATDNCGVGVTVTVQPDQVTAQVCANKYSILRVYVATDACGNTNTCSQSITVNDNIAPSITCPANLTVSCAGNIPPANTNAVIVSDNCSGTVAVTVQPDVISGVLCANEYTVQRIYVATDVCGNAATCLQTITVRDLTPPQLTCPAPVTVSCASAVPLPNINSILATDNCGAGVTVTVQPDQVTGQVCANKYSILRVYVATDACGNTNTCSQSITVNDNIAPSITCPANLTVSCAGNIPPANTNAVIVSDNCSGTVTVTVQPDVISGVLCANEYTVQRIYVATDVCGNTATCLQAITVRDLTPPQLTCPAPVTVSCASAVPLPNINSILATDNCGAGVTVTVQPDQVTGQVCANKYSILRVYVATDACGNTNTCSQSITVNDNIAPSITCPVNLTVSCASHIPLANTNAVIVSDNCGGSVAVTAQPDVISGVICANEYTVQRIYVATDVCGNTASCLQTITVRDEIIPQLNCPAPLTVSCASAVPLPDINSIAATDNCGGGVTVTVQPDQLTGQLCANKYSILRVYVATDACGNTNTCSQTITVNDNLAPSITCPANLTVSCAGNIPPANTAAVIASDNCAGLVTVTVAADVTVDQSCDNSLTVLRTYTAMDVCGNSATCTQTIRVQDLTDPVIDCPANLTLACTDNTLPASTGQATATDNCGAAPVVSYADITSSGECAEAYVITRTWTAIDACNNSTTCVQILNIVDEVAPSITCPGDITVSCASGIPSPDINAVIATDLCDETLTVTVAADVITSQTCDHTFTVHRTYFAQDGCGNSSSCTQVITVTDETAPEVSCPATISVSCAAEVPVADISLVTTSDNCGSDVVVTVGTDQVIDAICANRYTIIRTYIASDDCGNSASCTQAIVVSDDVSPVVACPANLTLTCAAEVPAPDLNLLTVSDNCAGNITTALLSDVITNLDCVNKYTLTRTYVATDACGNSATCAQVITVSDNVPPTLSCPADLTVVCADDVPAPNAGSLVSADNCGGTVTVTHAGDAISDASCPNQFTITRTYLSTDACGNTATCIQLITVDDTQPPAIAFTHPLLAGVQNGGTVNVQCYGQDPNWDLPVFNENSISALDQCDVPAIVAFTQSLEDEGDCRVDGYINLFRLAWTAEDSCGNTSSAFVFLKLIDTIPPVIEGVPADITVTADAIPEPPSVFALDECLCACLILHEQTALSEGCIDGQVIVRTWRATDDCGNTTVEKQHITIEDNDGPVLALMVPDLAEIPNGTVLDYRCGEGGIPEYYQLLGESSLSVTDFSHPVTINFQSDVDRPDNCEYFGYLEQHTFTWEAIDGCGNVSTMILQAEVYDDVAPVITGVPEVTCFNSPLLRQIEATDDCSELRFIHWDVEVPNPCGEGTAMRRTYEATDYCGNMTRDTAILISDDGTAPVLAFVNPVLMDLRPAQVIKVSCQANAGQLTPFSAVDVIATDGCELGMQVAFTERVLSEANCQDGSPLALVELIWTATDHCGNTSQKIVLAEIVDDIPPVLVDHEREISIGCNQRMPDIVAEDNCGEVIIETRDSVVYSLCESQYDVLRLITVTDPCGNVTTDRQWVHVGGTGPVISGIEEEVCNDLTLPVVTALDPCTGDKLEVTMSEDTLHDVCKEGIVIQRIWSATDACGNETAVTQHIVMNDISAPVITVPQQSIIRKFDDPDVVAVILLSQRDVLDALNSLNAFSVFALDDCDTEIIPDFTVQVVVPDNIAEAGYSEERIYTWVARDICGNTTILTFTVHILDDIPPVVSDLPGDLTIVCGPLPPVPDMLPADSLDPVNVIFTETIENGTNPGEFIVIRTWIFTDMSGNQTTVSQRILWIPETLLSCDIILPEQVDCNSHGVIISSQLSGGISPFTYIWEIEGDECFIQEGQNTPEIAIYVGWSDVDITLTVIDTFGCRTTCDAVLTCDLSLQGAKEIPDTEAEVYEDDQAFIASVETLRKLNLWPNPAKSTAQLSFETKEAYPVKYTLFNFLGRQVMQELVITNRGRNKFDLDIAHLPEGTYWITIESRDHSLTRKLIIMRS